MLLISILSVLSNMMGVEVGMPRLPPLLVVVEGADISFSIVPWGTTPLAMRAVILRCVAPGTIEVILTKTFELEEGLSIAPGTFVDSVRDTGALFVAIILKLGICSVTGSPAVKFWAKACIGSIITSIQINRSLYFVFI